MSKELKNPDSDARVLNLSGILIIYFGYGVELALIIGVLELGVESKRGLLEAVLLFVLVAVLLATPIKQTSCQGT